MKKKSKKAVLNPWYKRKRYLHFDFALKKPEAVEYILGEGNIAKHNFSPLIHYTKTSRQYKRDKKTRALCVQIKPRNIFYASHVDGYVYSYCNHELSKSYEEYLKKNHLAENVVAYRSLKKDGKGASNIHFAKDAFDFIKSTDECHILCLDITGFFDTLNTDILKANWSFVLTGSKNNPLPDDHYNVFWSLKNFHYVEEKDVIRAFNKQPRKRNKIDKNDKTALRRELNRSLHERICSFEQLKELKKSYSGTKGFIRYKETLKNKDGIPLTGIPQGTAISGLLSNIFMIDFDLEVKAELTKHGGCYRRYSDDIFLAFPKTVSFEEMNGFVKKTLNKISGSSLVINPKKTERRVYEAKGADLGICLNEAGKSAKIQYLGFTFDGEKVHIRSSSMSKNRSKISHVVRKNKKRKNKQTGFNNINTREVYKAQSPRKITPHNKLEDKGFVSYAKRSSDIHNSEAI